MDFNFTLPDNLAPNSSRLYELFNASHSAANFTEFASSWLNSTNSYLPDASSLHNFNSEKGAPIISYLVISVFFFCLGRNYDRIKAFYDRNRRKQLNSEEGRPLSTFNKKTSYLYSDKKNEADDEEAPPPVRTAHRKQAGQPQSHFLDDVSDDQNVFPVTLESTSVAEIQSTVPLAVNRGESTESEPDNEERIHQDVQRLTEMLYQQMQTIEQLNSDKDHLAASLEQRDT
mmetsp:Transcript_11538/g.17398  ORF Transcript_11538/g.17398 Transcript_11538/m.17398 type:complete len:230 (+) Transcript_11538:2-691(+)